MFTPLSQPVVRENSGVNQSTVAVVGSAAQSIANANSMLGQLGISAIGAENQDIDLVFALSEL